MLPTIVESKNQIKRALLFDAYFIGKLRQAAKIYDVPVSVYIYGVCTGEYKNLKELELVC